MAAVDDLRKACSLLEAGNWDAAHRIVQDDPSALAAWAHGIVHVLEGDLANADYWYRRAARTRPETTAMDNEIAALRRAIESDA